MYEVFISEGSKKPQSVTTTEHLEDYYNHMKTHPMCPEVRYKFDHHMCLHRGGIYWDIIEIRDKSIPMGVTINSADWKERITSKEYKRHCRIGINRPDVTIKDVHRFMQEFKPNGKTWCIVNCYGTHEIWVKRKEAIDFYYEGMLCCEGSERERYLNIVVDLKSGARIATDGE